MPFFRAQSDGILLLSRFCLGSFIVFFMVYLSSLRKKENFRSFAPERIYLFLCSLVMLAGASLSLPLEDSTENFLAAFADTSCALAPWWLIILFYPGIHRRIRQATIPLSIILLYSAVLLQPGQGSRIAGAVCFSGTITGLILWIGQFVKAPGADGQVLYSQLGKAQVTAGGGYILDLFLSGRLQLSPVLTVAGLAWSAWTVNRNLSPDDPKKTGGALWGDAVAPVLIIGALGGYCFLDYLKTLQGQPLWTSNNHLKAALVMGGIGAVLYLPGRFLMETLGSHMANLTMTPLEKAVSRWEENPGALVLPDDLDRMLEPFNDLSFTFLYRSRNSAIYRRWMEKQPAILYYGDDSSTHHNDEGKVPEPLKTLLPELPGTTYCLSIKGSPLPRGYLIFNLSGNAPTDISRRRAFSRIVSISKLPRSERSVNNPVTGLLQNFESPQELSFALGEGLKTVIPVTCGVLIIQKPGEKPDKLPLAPGGKAGEKSTEGFEKIHSNEPFVFDRETGSITMAMSGETFRGSIIVNTGLDGFILEEGDREAMLRLSGRASSALDRVNLRRQVNAHLKALGNLQRQGNEAVTRQRLSMAGEIHDTIAQELFAARLQVNLITKLLRNAPPEAEDELKILRDLMEKAQKDARSMISTLRTDSEGESEKQRVESLIIRLEQKGVTVNTTGLELLEEAPRDLHLVVVEILNNIIKHASPKRCKVRLKTSETPTPALILFIADDGAGFDPENSQRGESFGLSSIKNRCTRLGATVKIRSKKGRGSAFLIHCPRK